MARAPAGENDAILPRYPPGQASAVQSAGHGYRLKASVLKKAFESGGALQHLLLRLDRLPANVLVMTQKLIANMLGVRREGVTEAARRLQAEGLIHYSRGRITVLDRPGSRRECASATRWSRGNTTGC